jgi:uncharacterized protein
MNRNEALKRLRPHEAELRAAGLAALYLFGSTARNDAGEESDVDLACDIDHTKGLDMLGFAAIYRRIEAVMDRKIDLTTRRSMRPLIRERAEPDMVKVF